MKVVAWPKELGGDAREYACDTMYALWELVTARAEGNDAEIWVHEISANLDADGITPYLVLSWVETE